MRGIIPEATNVFLGVSTDQSHWHRFLHCVCFHTLNPKSADFRGFLFFFFFNLSTSRIEVSSLSILLLVFRRQYFTMQSPFSLFQKVSVAQPPEFFGIFTFLSLYYDSQSFGRPTHSCFHGKTDQYPPDLLLQIICVCGIDDNNG